MNIKITENAAPSKPKIPSFPFLGIHPKTGTIVYFLEFSVDKVSGRGIRLNENEEMSFGYIADCWAIDEFIPYEGQITIQLQNS